MMLEHLLLFYAEGKAPIKICGYRLTRKIIEDTIYSIINTKFTLYIVKCKGGFL